MASPALYQLEKGLMALRLYRRVMKLHIRNMPQDLRLFGKRGTHSVFTFNITLKSPIVLFIGDLYVKQEFRLHLDKATDD
jgi:hypothetical protein